MSAHDVADSTCSNCFKPGSGILRAGVIHEGHVYTKYSNESWAIRSQVDRRGTSLFTLVSVMRLRVLQVTARPLLRSPFTVERETHFHHSDHVRQGYSPIYSSVGTLLTKQTPALHRWRTLILFNLILQIFNDQHKPSFQSRATSRLCCDVNTFSGFRFVHVTSLHMPKKGFLWNPSKERVRCCRTNLPLTSPRE